MVRRIVPWMLLFLALFSFYFGLGNALADVTHRFEDEWLSIDTNKITRFLRDPEYEPTRHHRIAHPLFTLVLRPLGVPLSRLIGPESTVLTFGAAFGALGALGFHAILLLIGIRLPYAAAFTLLLSVSTVHTLHSAVPEAFIFAAASLMLPPLVFLLAKSDRRFVDALALATVVSAGITLTNAVLGILLFIAWFWKRPLREQIQYGLRYLVVFVIAFGFFLEIQKLLYPNTAAFLADDFVSAHSRWIIWGLFRRPLHFIGQLIPYFSIHSVVAPSIIDNPISAWDKYGLDFDDLPLTWILATLVYVPFVILSLRAIWTTRCFRHRVFVAFCVYYAFNFVLHLFFGTTEPHLYGAHYTFTWLTLLAFPFSAERFECNSTRHTFVTLRSMLFATCIVVTINNLAFLYRIYSGQA